MSQTASTRSAHTLTLANWIICLRSDAPDQRHTFALLIQNGEIASYRTAIGIDRG